MYPNTGGEMRSNLTWILLLVLPCVSVSPLPVHDLRGADEDDTYHVYHHNSRRSPEQENSSEEQVISVRITSSVAVGRKKAKADKQVDDRPETERSEHQMGTTATEIHLSSTLTDETFPEEYEITTTIPTELVGANMEFIKQLQSKKEARALKKYEKVQTFSPARNDYSLVNETDDNYAESSDSLGSVIEVENKQKEVDIINENIPMARSLSQSPSAKNFIQGLNHKSPSERGHPRLTTVSFNIVHDTPKVTSHYTSTETYKDPHQAFTNPSTFYNSPKIYNEPSKVYSEPAKVYSEPAKFYSEPAKIYSEPAKIYGEPAKIYSEPAKIYSEPAKFYSQPASLHLSPDLGSLIPWQQQFKNPGVSSTTVTTTPASTIAEYTQSSIGSSPEGTEHEPEKNYEIEEKVSVLTEGRSHGVQGATTESCKQESCKVGYVVEGRQYRKYRVEERTADGFIVGEYGVVRNDDGALRGVRYTADGAASPRLIYDALMKFLQLK